MILSSCIGTDSDYGDNGDGDGDAKTTTTTTTL